MALTTFGGLGYTFGHNLPMLGHYIGHATLALALLAALVTGLFLGGRWFRVNSFRISAQISRVAERIGSSYTLQHLKKRHPQAWEFVIRRFEPGEYLHWAHRFRYTLYDGLQIKHLNEVITVFCYGGAIIGTALAGYLLLSIP